MFKHDLLPVLSLTDELTPEGRYYTTPKGKFKSVTTVLSKYYNTKDFIEEWRQRIGQEEADWISQKARSNGTALHAVMEKDLLNDDKWQTQAHSIDRMRYRPVKRKLGHIDTVYGVELPLYSERLRTAGRSDAVVSWDGKPTILDLKTSAKYKKKEYIENYFVQATAYGIMVKELYGLEIEKIVILFSTNDLDCYYFEESLCDYMDLTEKIFQGHALDENQDTELQQVS